MSPEPDALQELRDELSRTREVLFQTAKLAELGRLTAVVVHELSQPLLGIKAFAQILERRTRDDSFVGPKIGIIVKQAGVMEVILDNLRQFSRRGRMDSGPFELRPVILGALELFGERARKMKVEFELDASGDLPPVRGNHGHLQQVIVNLVANSLDALEGRGGGRILLRVWAEAEAVCLMVADSGTGMVEAVRERLFEPFFTTKGEERGTGLGLSISREILTQHGAAIRLLSTEEASGRLGPDWSTVFEVRLARVKT